MSAKKDKAQEEDLSNYKKRKSEDSSSQDNDNSIDSLCILLVYLYKWYK
jgi:hypothetical protein